MSLTHGKSKTEASETEAAESPEFEALFNQQWDRICRVIYRLVGDWAEAEDIAIDAFLRLHQRPPKENQNLNGWLYRVAMNLGINSLRDRKRRQRYEDKAGRIILDENAPNDPERTLEHQQERERVRTSLASIKPRSAKLLILRHSGFSYAEIADAFQISPGSVGTLLARAEREFKKKHE
ncbi:MAG: sigma-70 family RNA polymerase sigma factor [Chloroflexota bacterium]|nr:sigma-70 family RNA polymerase sigma factor [Chloroflexota bacterium]